MKKRILCLLLLLCAALVLSSCQSQETYPNQPRSETASQATDAPAQSAAQQSAAQQFNFNDGSYDPASEEDTESEPVSDNPQTVAPLMQSEYAGATPVKIDPVDKPTATPLPTLTFSYANYTASALHLTFEGPAGWLPEETSADTYTLTNPDPSMDYAAQAVIHTVAVGKDYTQKELIAEVKAQVESIRGAGNFQSFDPSDTAARFFIDGNGVYMAYRGYLNDGNETGVAGRVIVNTVNKTLYILHVSYPRALADTFADGVYNKIRHSMKLAQ